MRNKNYNEHNYESWQQVNSAYTAAVTYRLFQSTVICYLSKSKSKPQFFYLSKSKKYFVTKLLE